MELFPFDLLSHYIHSVYGVYIALNHIVLILAWELSDACRGSNTKDTMEIIAGLLVLSGCYFVLHQQVSLGFPPFITGEFGIFHVTFIFSNNGRSLSSDLILRILRCISCSFLLGQMGLLYMPLSPFYPERHLHT